MVVKSLLFYYLPISKHWIHVFIWSNFKLFYVNKPPLFDAARLVTNYMFMLLSHPIAGTNQSIQGCSGCIWFITHFSKIRQRCAFHTRLIQIFQHGHFSLEGWNRDNFLLWDDFSSWNLQYFSLRYLLLCLVQQALPYRLNLGLLRGLGTSPAILAFAGDQGTCMNMRNPVARPLLIQPLPPGSSCGCAGPWSSWAAPLACAAAPLGFIFLLLFFQKLHRFLSEACEAD